MVPIILLPLLLLIFSHLSATNACYEAEREILLSFKSHLLDPSNRLSSWQGQNCCSWHGIRCSDSLHVTTLDLRNPNPESFIINRNSELVSTSDSNFTAITGTIPPSLFSLTHISYLDLSFNNFTFSKIPTGLANLTSLTYLNLSNAMFSGSLTTQFSNLTSLRVLDLSCSFPVIDYSTISYNVSSSVTFRAGSFYTHIYMGSLSSSNLNWLQKFNNLRFLILNGVNLSEAPLSPISNLWNLRMLQLSNCQISGRIPIKQLLNLTRLSYLSMGFNFLRTQIPLELANLTSLSVIDLWRSSLQGSFPYLPQLKELNLGNNSDLIINLHNMFAFPWPQLEVIDISSTQVNGTIPPSIGNITSLREFAAFDCSIQGQVPTPMMHLSHLEFLMLGGNTLNGRLSPSISNLKSLQLLYLLENSFEGSIPDTICIISSLKYIDLADNSFTGNLPDCISQLPNLCYFLIGFNKMSGTIPSLAYFVQNPTLEMIDLGFSGLTVNVDKHPFSSNFQPQALLLDSCNLGGEIPIFISNLTQLTFLSLSNNSLSGRIPSWLLKLPNLGYLDLSLNNLHGALPLNIKLKSCFFRLTTLPLENNQLQGPIPSSLENVDAVDLSRNNFTGHIPTQLGCQNIKYLSLSANKLSGDIPSSFCDANNQLMLLDLSNNCLRGTVPTNLGNCTSLIFLNLGGNNLIGQIPKELEGAKNLNYLDISGNLFDGSFPSVLHKLQRLMVLNLGSNRFEGSIPRYIGDLQDLRILVLEFNSFNGSIPKDITKLEKLQIIGFSNNQLSGPIPEKLSGLKKLTTQTMDGSLLCFIISDIYAGVEVKMVIKEFLQHLKVVHTYTNGIDLSCNNLTGSLPSELGLLRGLYMLNLSHNQIFGDIPTSISSMSTLESLDLSFNSLSGEIPTTLTLLDFLTTLSLSYNNLSGKIPTGPHFDTLSRDGLAYTGNKFLCGAPDAVITCDSKSSSGDPETTNLKDSGQQQVLFYAAVITGYGVGTAGFFLILQLMNETWTQGYWTAIDRIALRIIRCSKMVQYIKDYVHRE
ncbi:hypothetical protein SLA2020_064400 [Shorea laevis]